MADERLADDHDLRRVRRVARLDAASGDYRNTECREEPRRYDANIGGGALVGRAGWPIAALERDPHAVLRQRSAERQRRTVDIWQCTHAVQQPVGEGDRLLVPGILGGGKRDAHRHHVFRSIARIHGAYQKNHGERHLGNDKRAASASRSAPAARSARALLEHLADVRVRRVQSGDEPKEQSRYNGDGDAEKQHAAVDCDVGEARHTARTECLDRVHRPGGERRADQGAGEREQHTFRHQLADEPLLAGA